MSAELHSIAWSSPTAQSMDDKSFGVYIMCVSYAGDNSSRVVPESFLAGLIESAPGRRKVIRNLVGQGVAQAHADGLELTLHHESHDWWWYLGSPDDNWPLARIHRSQRQGKRRGTVPRRCRDAVLARDGLICGLCGDPVERDDLHIDHILPVALGGTDDLDNLQPAHATCNLKKGARVA